MTSHTGGYIQLHRSIKDSLVMSDDWLCRLWISCLVKTNWKEGSFKGERIGPGQFAFSYRLWCEHLGVSKSKLERGLKKLANEGQLTLKSRHKFVVVTICNWGTYQSPQPGNESESGREQDENETVPRQEPDGEGTESGRRRSTIEEGKKERTEEGKELNTHTPPGNSDSSPSNESLPDGPSPESAAQAWQRFQATWNKLPEGARGVTRIRGMSLPASMREPFADLRGDPDRWAAAFDAMQAIADGKIGWDRPAISLSKFLTTDLIDRLVSGAESRHEAARRPEKSSNLNTDRFEFLKAKASS